MVRPWNRTLNRPSCGIRFSAMSSSDITLMRLMIVGVVPLVDRLHRLVQNAVDAVLDDDLAILGLDVDVRRPPLDGVEENGVDQPDDR